MQRREYTARWRDPDDLHRVSPPGRPGRTARKIVDGRFRCGTCEKNLPVLAFGANRATPTGLKMSCKACVKKRFDPPDDPDWPTCGCGCGEPVPVHKNGNKAKGWKPGDPCEYVKGHVNRSALGPDGLYPCGKCGERKPPKDFSKDPAKRLGFSSPCKKCQAGWHQLHRKKIQQTPEYKKWNREKASARRAQERNQWVEDVDHFKVYDRSEGICGICGEPADRDDFHVDHIIPIARGGEHSYANTQAAHPRCNQSKHAKLPQEGL